MRAAYFFLKRNAKAREEVPVSDVMNMEALGKSSNGTFEKIFTDMISPSPKIPYSGSTP